MDPAPMQLDSQPEKAQARNANSLPISDFDCELS